MNESHYSCSHRACSLKKEKNNHKININLHIMIKLKGKMMCGMHVIAQGIDLCGVCGVWGGDHKRLP